MLIRFYEYHLLVANSNDRQQWRFGSCARTWGPGTQYLLICSVVNRCTKNHRVQPLLSASAVGSVRWYIGEPDR